MIPLSVQFVGEDGMIKWPATNPEKTIHLGNGGPGMQVAVLEKGMQGGKPSIMLRIDLPDGKTVLAETSARLWCTAARMIMVKYPDLFVD